jgi:hypothetical protein
MTTTKKNMPAFPVSGIFSGMTLRDYFAAKAMQAIVSHEPTFAKEFIEMAAKDAYSYADAMLKDRNGNS